MKRPLNLKKSFLFLSIFTLAFGYGCTHVPPQPKMPIDSRIAPILSGFGVQNANLHSFNGIGSITITDQYRTNNFRLAWAGKCPDQIKMIVLFSGNPVETMATDGEFLYIKSHNNRHPFINNKVKNPNLEGLIKFPVTTDQIIFYLAGHIPVLDYNYATIEKKEEKKQTVINLYKDDKIIEKFIIDEKNRVNSLEVTEKDNIRYDVLMDINEDGVFIFPKQIQASQGERSIVIRIEKNTPNPDLPPETFKISKD